MDFEKEKEFKPSWGLLVSYCVTGGTFGHSCVSLRNQFDIDKKPEITTTVLNEVIDHINNMFKYKNIVILNSQIIWISEYLK